MQVQDDDKTIIGGFSLELTHSVQVDDGLKYLVIKELTIGRSDACDIKIDDKKISRTHAKFNIVDDELVITDLDSSNGTFVNGKRIQKATKLKNNDSVKVESHELKIIISANLPEKLEEDDKTRIVETVEEIPVVITEKTDKKSVDEPKPEENKIQNTDGLKPPDEKETTTEPEVKEVINKSKEEIPTSWVEETGSMDGTRMMDPKEIEAIKSGVKRDITPADSTMTCLHCFSENAAEQIFELPVSDFEEASGWEIGRDSNCDIVIEHSSVSNRHAQIIHQRGRWKIVNLVSTNGIVINGQKKLSAYLGDGDKVGLGSVDLIFKTPKSKQKFQSKNNKETKGNNVIVPIVMGLVLIGLAVGIYLNI